MKNELSRFGRVVENFESQCRKLSNKQRSLLLIPIIIPLLLNPLLLLGLFCLGFFIWLQISEPKEK
jgi:hypothetical protein